MTTTATRPEPGRAFSTGATTSPAGEPVEHPPLYTDVESWVNGYFAPMFLHRVPGNPRARWCGRWWEHAEVIARLTVLWQSWEGARWEPSAKPGWWLDLDHHLPILIGLDGPMRNCRHAEGDRPSKHEPDAPAAIELAPPGWWD